MHTTRPHHVHGIEYEVNSERQNQTKPSPWMLIRYHYSDSDVKMHYKNVLRRMKRAKKENKYRAALGTWQWLTRLIDGEWNDREKKVQNQ